jgi:hypothetical protein
MVAERTIFKAGHWRPMVPRVPRAPRVSRKEPALAFSAHVRLHFLDPCYLTLVFFTLHWDGGWSLPEAMKVHERESHLISKKLIRTTRVLTRSSRGGIMQIYRRRNDSICKNGRRYPVRPAQRTTTEELSPTIHPFGELIVPVLPALAVQQYQYIINQKEQTILLLDIYFEQTAQL